MAAAAAALDAGPRLRHPGGDDDGASISTSASAAATATEDTPLLRSETASSLTARDASPAPLLPPPIGIVGDGDGLPPGYAMGRGQTVCIVLSMWALIFLQASNMSGITTTQSTIAADLDAYEYAMWFTSAYMITASSVTPLVGRLAMIFSSGPMILFSALFFSVGALVTSQAQSFVVFILGRVLVGVGAGGIMTLSLILVIQLTSKRRRGLWVGLTNAGFSMGVSTGAVVFGALLPVLGWRALFWAQSPIGVLAGFGVYFSIPPMAAQGASKDMTTRQKLARLDYAGAVTLTLTIVLFLYGLSGTIQMLPIALSLVTLALFILIESSFALDPIIPLTVLKDRGILLSCFSQLGFMAARWTVLFYAPVFVLAVRGLSPAVAGSILIPTNLGFGLGGLVVGFWHIRRAGSFWAPSLAGLLFFALSVFALSFVGTATASLPLYVLVVFANGLATGAALNYTLAHLLHLSAPDTHFIVTGLLSTFRGFAGSFGTAIGGGIFVRSLRAALAAGFERLDDGHLSDTHAKLITVLVGSPAAVQDKDLLSPAERLVAVHGYEHALRILYHTTAIVCVLVIAVQAGTGWALPPAVHVPPTRAEEGEIEEAILEHDGTMEA
ncbi:major facilitator superfamily domain-containing protein [Lasiosphaeria miniovina]|uniref:Major facilitator superfamily domain-containing protein n=1 Tax=Lasiosphaeria miniovina TaxID=1954250 RepID=A0AA40B3D2_9PEZI|nr:major facilitator superfamily domain-containing protein [Lasiosphaeria miniovina]KAK0726956.1 major facilitator superfamily domain-containing protein [Lasiosphaeria miniovina]